ncbi:putative 26S proteasome regulatory subunit [Clavispora lusitaniae]|uniref:26S proteasome regulatory subunit n=1 Tax=Clavispora lusitaniae TaxID=36911 RepID=A0ACD0WPY0_CLALS|nr:putative 26S proteasome regulatory subunit [Clavispora lusitaniae]QFZ35087.1 putative 26S proteasome regulatory subunit [Clavispora lusitaniae]QFZ40772.1 putative 26S proteasome regulatory subunit [Clavispora lusitaniae]QFZ46452.1 putative 26S proteasome regulatory subunit [Clavispora lusitaniae]QFZ52114.1 putative 26S proteasome regulatory subunit [Clavispora lusitaniae]
MLHCTIMALPKLAAELNDLFEKKKYDECEKLLPPLKLELIQHNLLVPLPSNTQTQDQLNDLKNAERILEIGALSSLLAHSYANFENLVASLKPFYACGKLHAKNETNTDATKITALYLLYLLSQGHISKFHLELETIYYSPLVNVEQDKYLLFPIDLERNMMEGNYLKIWKLLQDNSALPCTEFEHFTSTLVNTLRHEIAKSIEKTNSSIPINNCKTLMHYAQEYSDSAFEEELKSQLDVGDWVFKDGVIYFDNVPAPDETVSDNTSTVFNVLSYAEQIESIV